MFKLVVVPLSFEKDENEGGKKEHENRMTLWVEWSKAGIMLEPEQGI